VGGGCTEREQERERGMPCLGLMHALSGVHVACRLVWGSYCFLPQRTLPRVRARAYIDVRTLTCAHVH
jgi:hypothetical protein